MKNLTLPVALTLTLLAPVAATRAETARTPRSYRAAAAMPDTLEALSPSFSHLDGYLGRRVANNEKDRLLEVDLKPLLAGYQHRPGSHPWIGEHIGKWMHAATLAWAYTGDKALKAKLDGAVRDLIATQEPDGYLGTYAPDKRFGLYPGNDWDVWSHKYCLLGLLTYYQYTGSQPALTTCRKIGDLLIRTFGPGKKSILSAGTHFGMAATSVLEPVVLLYRNTGDTRYLDFAKYIVKAWDEPTGPHVLTTLTTLKSVGKTANGKAYEMLSNLVGLCELARATGDRTYLVPALNAWNDVVANQLYLTGTASYGEIFHANHDLPNKPNFSIGETCVTVTWIQLTSQLLRLTGEAKYGNELERSYYNHLAAAQRPDGAEWCYYTALEGTKPYGPGINCCVSSGPRGMALAPTMAYFKRTEKNRRETLVVNLLESSHATLKLGGQNVTVTQESRFPVQGVAELRLRLAKPAKFGLQVRAPKWGQPFRIALADGEAGHDADGWVRVPARLWHDGERVTLRFSLTAKVITGEYGNKGRAALTWGPFVMAYDEAYNPGLPSSTTLVLENPGSATLRAENGKPALSLTTPMLSLRDKTTRPAVFVPFAEAGTAGSRYRIWMVAPGAETHLKFSLLMEGKESRNAEGNVGGSIVDGDRDSFVVTYDGKLHREDWFAITLPVPTVVRRIVYTHGMLFHDGGWFDASAGKPRIEIKRTMQGDWEQVGVLSDYPETTATDAKELQDRQEFTLTLPEPTSIVAVRVVGKSACGDSPEQSFSSCAELQAFEN